MKLNYILLPLRNEIDTIPGGSSFIKFQTSTRVDLSTELPFIAIISFPA